MNIRQILDVMRPEIEKGLRDRIELGFDDYSREFEFGTACINVEMSRWGKVDVDVFHEDARHWSPRIIESVMDIMPHWATVEADVESEREMSWQDDFMVFGLYD